MHQHYHTIRQLSAALLHKLSGAVLKDAYTLSKEELFLLFASDGLTLSIKVVIRNNHCFLLFGDEEIKRPSNAQAIFTSIYNKHIESVQQHPYNRSFEIRFEHKAILVFKMYDALANVILFQQGGVDDLFRPQINNDHQLKPEDFYQVNEQIKNKIETDPVVDGEFGIIKTGNQQLPYSLVLSKADLQVYFTQNVFDGLNQFARLNLAYLHFAHLKAGVLQAIKAEVKKTKALIQKSEAQLAVKENEITPEETGHIIMANMHIIPAGAEKVTLFDFYHQTDVEIKLKKDLSPQENAAYYYRKSRNRKKETEELNGKILHAVERLTKLESDLATVMEAQEMKTLKPFIKEKIKKEETIPFKVFLKDGFTIWVGKNAANNDLLTTKYAHKNDLWLHAKDVSGSHVVIKHQGQVFPQQVIQYAASVAAYYSKLKGSALVPVSYTHKKFVRKPKGLEPGQVIVDKEEVLLVAPSID